MMLLQTLTKTGKRPQGPRLTIMLNNARVRPISKAQVQESTYKKGSLDHMCGGETQYQWPNTSQEEH